MIHVIKCGFNLGFNKYNIQYTVNDFWGACKKYVYYQYKLIILHVQYASVMKLEH